MTAFAPRQLAVLRAIHELTVKHGYPPALREVGKAAGLSSSSAVWYHIDRLRQAGHMVNEDGLTRTLRLTYKGLIA